VRVGRVAVVNVAGNEDVMNTIALSERAEPLDGGESRLPQRLLFGAELLEDFADLPVGRVNDSHDGSSFLDVATGWAA
jgi:predicted component of type VI protein secretion system